VPKEYYILAVGLVLEKKQSTILIKYKPTGILINVTLYANKLAALLTINQILPINGKEIYNLQIDFLLKRKNL
jgi:ACT domain-containing protein